MPEITLRSQHLILQQTESMTTEHVSVGLQVQEHRYLTTGRQLHKALLFFVS